MDPNRFDAITKVFAERRLSRRSAVGTGLAAGATAVFGSAAASAQDATPAATPESAPSPITNQPPSQLFVQSFQSGSIAANADGTHTMTLEQGLGQTIVFSDRPSREVFTAPTPAFLDGLGFDPDNPPNAAIVMEVAEGDTDIAVVELFNPTYDDATHTATYDVSVLANWETELELGFQEAPTDLSNLATSFGPTHLFIDGCKWADECGVRVLVGMFPEWRTIGPLPDGPYEKCWHFGDFVCHPCNNGVQNEFITNEYLNQICNQTYGACEGQCEAS
jgi:hypothetical protein